ncbi:MAG: serine/threonine protein kinase, partial [Planctomycetota bacterium]
METQREFENRCTLKIVREIASGGMGTVSEAIQLGAGGFSKRVAIKEILSTAIGDSSYEEMLVAEAKLVANLVHENIIQIYQLNRSESG